jgi:hypothetical protein
MIQGERTEMSIQIELSPEAEVRLTEQAATQGQAAAEYVQQMLERELMRQALVALKDRQAPKSLSDLKPRIPSPPGTSWLEQVRGQWPGDETDEEVFEALGRLS